MISEVLVFFERRMHVWKGLGYQGLSISFNLYANEMVSASPALSCFLSSPTIPPLSPSPYLVAFGVPERWPLPDLTVPWRKMPMPDNLTSLLWRTSNIFHIYETIQFIGWWTDQTWFIVIPMLTFCRTMSKSLHQTSSESSSNYISTMFMMPPPGPEWPKQSSRTSKGRAGVPVPKPWSVSMGLDESRYV